MLYSILHDNHTNPLNAGKYTKDGWYGLYWLFKNLARIFMSWFIFIIPSTGKDFIPYTPQTTRVFSLLKCAIGSINSDILETEKSSHLSSIGNP